MVATKLDIRMKAIKYVEIVERGLQSRRVFFSLIIATFIMFSVLFAFKLLSGYETHSGGLFLHDVFNVSKQYSLSITPSEIANTMWALIYICQLYWTGTSLFMLCFGTTQGPADLNPVILSPDFFIFFSLSCAFNIGWLFLYDRLLFLASFVFMVCIALSLSLTFAIVSSRLALYSNTLVDQGRIKELVYLRTSVINGVAIYATWTVIVSLHNLGIVMVYKLKQPISDEIACVICLSILAFLVVLYIALDVTILERYTRYSLGPYFIVIITLTDLIDENYNADKVSSIISGVLIGFVCIALVIKFGVTIYNHINVKNQYLQMKMGKSVASS